MRRIMVLAATGVLILAACGDDDSASGSGSTVDTGASTSDDTGASASDEAPPVSLTGTVNDHGTGDATSGELEVEVDDVYFAPTYITAEAGATVILELVNEGSMKHTFTIDGTNVDGEVEPGGTLGVQVEMPATGSLRFYCRFHQGSGMQGAFVIT